VLIGKYPKLRVDHFSHGLILKLPAIMALASAVTLTVILVVFHLGSVSFVDLIMHLIDYILPIYRESLGEKWNYLAECRFQTFLAQTCTSHVLLAPGRFLTMHDRQLMAKVQPWLFVFCQ